MGLLSDTDVVSLTMLAPSESLLSSDLDVSHGCQHVQPFLASRYVAATFEPCWVTALNILTAHFLGTSGLHVAWKGDSM